MDRALMVKLAGLEEVRKAPGSVKAAQDLELRAEIRTLEEKLSAELQATTLGCDLPSEERLTDRPGVFTDKLIKALTDLRAYEQTVRETLKKMREISAY